MRTFTVLSSLYSEYESLSLLETGSICRGRFDGADNGNSPGANTV